MQEPNKFELSLTASGITRTQAQKILDFKNYQTLTSRLSDPGVFRLDELKTLKRSMTEQGSSMLMEAISDFFCDET